MLGTGGRWHRGAAWLLAVVPAVVGGCRAAGDGAGDWAEPPRRGADPVAFAFRRGECDALQTAVLRMRGPGPVLLLAGTWHVGAPEYYARLERVLERADLVL